MQQEIVKPSNLLDNMGELTQRGWAKNLILNYNREDIKAPKYRIKEWDYYLIMNNNFGIALTIADNAYMGFVSATFLDFTIPREKTKSIITPFPMGKINMPSTSKNGNILFENKKTYLEFIRDKNNRILKFNFSDFCEKKALKGEINLSQSDNLESMVIATPFLTDKKAFYYNQKINCMPAKGQILFGSEKYCFNPCDSYGVLDWGRGVWTYKNTWYWGSGSGFINGVLFGFNIGYGFGDDSFATENMLFYDGKCHKLDKILFNIPEDDFMKPWEFSSNDGRFEMKFQPIIDRKSHSNVILIESDQHQVFGLFNGRVILDDGKEIEVKDFLAFAEKVYNRW